MPPKRKRKIHGLYFHSSPPKVFPMNNQIKQKMSENGSSKDGIVIKPSNIRIWIHDKDIGKLAKVLWAGQGNRLRTEVSSNTKVKKFLEAVPFVMNIIKDIHSAVIDNDLDFLMAKTASPVPAILLSSKDINGLTPLHKAAGLAHTRIVEYLLNVWPSAATDIDASGKTPLHWAASAKNNTRSYNLLTAAGADEQAMDYKSKTPIYYKNKPNDLDRSLLTVIPDAPRVPTQGLPAGYDWQMFGDDTSKSITTNNNYVKKSQSNYDSYSILSNEPPKTNLVRHSSTEAIRNGTIVSPKNSLSPYTRNRNSLEVPALSGLDNGISERNRPLTTEEQAVLVAINPENEILYNQTPSNPSPRSATPINGDEDENDIHSFKSDTFKMPDKTTEIDETKQGSNDDIDESTTNTDENTTDNGNTVDKGNDDSDIKNHSEDNIDANENNDYSVEEFDDQKDNEVDRVYNNRYFETESIIDNTDNDDENAENEDEQDNSVHDDNVLDGDNEDNNDDDDKTIVENHDENENDNSLDNEENTEHDSNDENEEQLESDEVKETNVNNDNVNEDNISVHEISDNEDNTNTGNDDKLESNVDVEIFTYENQLMTDPNVVEHNDSDLDNNNDNLDNDDNIENEINVENIENVEHVDNNDHDHINLENEIESSNDNENNDDHHQHNHSADNKDAGDNDDELQDNGYEPDDDDTEIPTQHNDNKTEAAQTDNDNHQTKINNNHDNEQDGGGDNEINGDEDDDKDDMSPSPAMQIEIMVRGEPDNGGVQSEGGNFPTTDESTDDEEKIKEIISSGDMEQLAALVLNGDGRKLIGLTSDQPEIQAFLDNVPAYMNKIRRVHLAAREGSLRDLQSALDRRKFAVAKDDISPNGASPLHVAAIFGHAGIVRYLAGRFPETTAAVDDNGRSALHYAATVHDNGHFYNLLTHLGANPKSEDNLGHSAEYYMNHEQSNSILSHRQLLKDFGAQEDLADDMLTDQDNNQVEIPLFRTEEGRYLATTLGDPLIKGLTEVANSRPTDPIAFLANYLNGFAKQRRMSSNTTEPVTNVDKIEEAAEEPNEAINVPPTKRLENDQLFEDVPSSPEAIEMAPNSDERDEHGQSLLHFACARSHGRNGLVQLIEESGVSLAYRDELYRTARDVSIQASQPENAKEIDRYILGFAARGEIDIFENLLAEGYDHIINIEDGEGQNIIQVAKSRNHKDVEALLESIRSFEETREQLHRAIRSNDIDEVKRITSLSNGAKLVRAKNYYGRCATHIAVLKENEEIVEHLASQFKGTLRIGDNLERTPLHYAMGVSSVEALSRILIKNGSKRVLKDLKGRQPSYYFMNKADILRLKEEEDEDD